MNTDLAEQFAFGSLVERRQVAPSHQVTVVHDDVEESARRQQRLQVDHQLEEALAVVHRLHVDVT